MRISGIAFAKVLMVAFGLTLPPLTAPAPADAQRYRPHVYNPSRHNATRSTMNHRAAARAAELRRYCRAHPRAERCRKTAAARRRR